MSGVDNAQPLSAMKALTMLSTLDCQMPEMDGFEATTEIRRRERTGGQAAHTPIVALTASAMLGDRQKYLAVGMEDFLPKPIHAGMLRSVLERWIGSKSAEERIAEPVSATGNRDFPNIRKFYSRSSTMVAPVPPSEGVAG